MAYSKRSSKKFQSTSNSFIVVLAIGAIALALFAVQFLKLAANDDLSKDNPITSATDLDKMVNALASPNPDTFKSELNSNSTDAANF